MGFLVTEDLISRQKILILVLLPVVSSYMACFCSMAIDLFYSVI